ncbi:MAG: nicotinate-nucleotide adenylyltransferase [Sulfurimonas sp.]|jgi:nicotinate-nucleotide adenylyltransferase|uniref:nicotinate (nicotinamide) nucleotide adenylyltransferase n=1 Tax=Sulfurimonas sp. TaxID=2022749 RepID=UPI0039E6CEE9
METIALFGGSFDPPHIGHECIVKEVLELDNIDRVIVMPTFLNPFKSQSHAPSELRLKWLKGIFEKEKNVEISSFEVNLKKKVPSIESVQHLLHSYQRIYLIIGADNLESLHKWERYRELEHLVTFVIATRDDIKVPHNFLAINIEENISSSQLREMMDSTKLSNIYANEIIKFYKEKN